MDYAVLNNGVKMPKIGYGVYQIPSSVTERCVRDALSVGYRSIDTAQCYGNEAAVGRAIKGCGIPRGEIFVTTKLWGGRGYRDTVKSIDSSLKALGMDAIDLLLIHEPTGDFTISFPAVLSVNSSFNRLLQTKSDRFRPVAFCLERVCGAEDQMFLHRRNGFVYRLILSDEKRVENPLRFC